MRNVKAFWAKNSPMLIAAGLVILIFFVGRYLLISLGIIDDPDDVKAAKKLAVAIDDAQSRLVAQGQTLSQPLAYWNTVAGAIYEDLRYSSISDNKHDAILQLKKVQNDLDVYTLLQAFGFRQEYLFGIPSGGLQDLVAFVGSNFDDSQKQSVNAYYKAKAIAFRF